MNFIEINDNGTVEGFCLVKNLEVKKTAKGRALVKLQRSNNENFPPRRSARLPLLAG